MLVKFARNRTVQTTQDFELFDKKARLFITIFDKQLTPISKTFPYPKLLFNAKLLIYRLSLSAFQTTALQYLQPG